MTAEPNEASAHNDRGRGLADQELYDKAIEEYRKADELWQKDQSKDRKLALRNWADALREQEHYEQAAEKCQKAIGVDPEYADAYLQPGRVLADQELFDQAIKQYRQADEKWQKDRSHKRKLALYYWGDALRWQGDYKQAAEKCQEAIGIDPDYPEAHNGLGRVRAGQERFDEAIDKFACAAKIVPQDAMAVYRFGHSLAEPGRYRDALAQFDKASLLDHDDPLPHHSKAHFLFQLGRYEEGWKEWRAARQCYERAFDGKLRVDQLGNAVNFAGVLGEIFTDYEKSEGFYQRVLERQDDIAEAWAGRAILFQQLVSVASTFSDSSRAGDSWGDTRARPGLGPNDFRASLPRFTPEAMAANQALVDLLERIAEQKKATPAQIALAWLLAQKPWIVPIPGTTKLHRLEENLDAADVALTAADLAEIQRAAAQIHVEGERYPEQLMATTGR